MPRDSSSPVAGTDDQLLKSAVGELPALPNIRADDADRFAQGVRALVESRAQMNWPNESDRDDVAVFILVDRPRETGDRFAAIPIMDPVATDERLLGRLFFMNRDASKGRRIDLPTEPSEIGDWISDNNLGNQPVIIVYRQSLKMATRRSGIEDHAYYDRIRNTKPKATMSDLVEALEFFHDRQLTPTSCADGIWEANRAAEYVPGRAPEKAVQRSLCIVLSSWFRGVVRVESEDSISIGRIDVRLLKPSMEEKALAYWAIIELKVIRSFTNALVGHVPNPVSASQNVAGIVEGLKQAWAYRSNREAEEGLVEIFDLRKDKSEDLLNHPDVVATLQSYAPAPRHNVRPIFGSSQDARNAGYTGI